MTNPIGCGTCNMAINVPLDERTELGRLAFQAGAKSVGDFLRLLVIEGLAQLDKDAAARVREIRRKYYGATMLLVFIGALLCGEELDLRRARTTVRARRDEQTEAA